MAKSKQKAKSKKQKASETDSAYFLKLVLFLILSSAWLRITMEGGTQELPLPMGAVIALVFASHEHFAIDRKLEYLLILLGMFIAFWLPVGIYVAL